MTRSGRLSREVAAAIIFICWLILPAVLVGAVTYFVLGFVINIIRTVYF
jgi:hypothetical protein